MSKRRLALAVVGVYLETEETNVKRKRSVWVRSWLSRKNLGIYDNLLRELSLEDKDSYRRWLRMGQEILL